MVTRALAQKRPENLTEPVELPPRLLVICADASLAIDRSAPVQEEDLSDDQIFTQEDLEEMSRLEEERQGEEKQGEEPQPQEEGDFEFPDVHDVTGDALDVVEAGEDEEEDEEDGFVIVDPTSFIQASGTELEDEDVNAELEGFDLDIDYAAATGAGGDGDDGSGTHVEEDTEMQDLDPAQEGFHYWCGWLANKFRQV